MKLSSVLLLAAFVSTSADVKKYQNAGSINLHLLNISSHNAVSLITMIFNFVNMKFKMVNFHFWILSAVF